MRSMIFVALLAGACSSGIGSDAAGVGGRVAGEAEAAGERERTTCSNAMLRAGPLRDGYSFSVFSRFNPYPSLAPAKRPDDITLRAPTATPNELLACVPEGAFEFDILEAGLLRAGTIRDLHPIGVFLADGGNFLALYLHKNYETIDGEGVTVEASGLLMDPTGQVIDAAQELASWYEYEGSIRIRDFVYAEGSLVTTEQVYDPSAFDSVANPLKYREGGMEVIKKYDLGGDRHP